MSDLEHSAAAPAPARPRILRFLWQVALGFFAPTVLVLFRIIGLHFTVKPLGQGGSHVVSYGAEMIVWTVLWIGLWMWSGRRGWRGIRVGILLFLVFVIGAVAWLLSVTFGLFARH